MPKAKKGSDDEVEKKPRKARGSKKAKDPNMPKRNKSAYFFFCDEKRPEMKAKYPDYKVTELAKKLGEAWKALDEDDKKEYNESAKKDKERYEKQKKEYLGKKEHESEEEKEASSDE